MAQQDPAAAVSFSSMFGPMLIGALLNVMLFGVFMAQAHSYFQLYKTNYSWTRYLVVYLIIMEILNTICNVGVVYQPLISLRDSPLALMKAPRLLAANPVVTVLISTPAQLVMAWRIRLVTKSYWLAGLITLLAFTSFVGGVIAATIIPTVRILQLQGALATWLSATAFADLFITAFFVNFLWSSKTGLATQTDNVTDKIIFLAFQTGALTSFAAISDATLVLLVPKPYITFIWHLSLSKLYSISLLSVLNARAEWNVLLDDLPADEKNFNGIIKIRRPTDIRGLQLYIPGNFPSSPRRRTPATSWAPHGLPTTLRRVD
ncbi:hypothetical protein C8J57DRAFT_1370736 [Mycena rebaudengoi]|nr:hypothetical protein C8J57DRAFT_1370736 [Mycena rebaudengoi]